MGAPARVIHPDTTPFVFAGDVEQMTIKVKRDEEGEIIDYEHKEVDDEVSAQMGR